MSENAKAVARDVLETIGKHQMVNLGKIIRKRGYSKETSKSPQLVTETKTFQEEIEKGRKPILEQIENERQRIIDAMAKKELSKEEYKVLIDGLDKTTKNIQLLSGGATERRVLLLPSEVIERYELDTSAKVDSE